MDKYDLPCKERLERELPLQSLSVKLSYSKPKLLGPAGRLNINLKTPFVKVNRNQVSQLFNAGSKKDARECLELLKPLEFFEPIFFYFQHS